MTIYGGPPNGLLDPDSVPAINGPFGNGLFANRPFDDGAFNNGRFRFDNVPRGPICGPGRRFPISSCVRLDHLRDYGRPNRIACKPPSDFADRLNNNQIVDLFEDIEDLRERARHSEQMMREIVHQLNNIQATLEGMPQASSNITTQANEPRDEGLHPDPLGPQKAGERHGLSKADII